MSVIDNDTGLVIEGYTEEEMQAVLDSDDPDLIERMLSGEKVSFSEDEPADNETVETTEIKPSTSSEIKQDEESAASGAPTDENNVENQDEEKFIESKSGGNKIPYTVLEQTRKERDNLKSQLAESQVKLTALESNSTKLQSRLEKAGIDLSALEQGEKLSEEQLTELEQIDPAIANLARVTMGLVERVESVQARFEENPQQNHNTADPVISAIESNKDLSAWRDGDADRWEMAVFYDEQLKNTPAFKDKPLNVRFEEAVRLTKTAFGDPGAKEIPKPRVNPTDVAAEKVAAAANKTVPRTLTDLGASPNAERKLGEVLADLDESSLVDRLADMSQDQIDKALAELG